MLLHTPTVCFLLFLLADASLAVAIFPNTVKYICAFFDRVIDLTCSDVGLFSFEQTAYTYQLPGRSSTFKASHLLNYTKSCEADRSQMKVTKRPASLEAKYPGFPTALIQFIFQMCIIKKPFIHDPLKLYVGSTEPVKPYGRTDLTNGHRNVQRVMEYFILRFFNSTTTSSAKHAYSIISHSAVVQKENGPLHDAIFDIIQLCYNLGKYRTTGTAHRAFMCPPPTQCPRLSTPCCGFKQLNFVK